MKIYLLTPFIFFSILVNAQTPEVIGELDLTTEQKRVQHIEDDLIRPKEDEYSKLIIKLNLHSYYAGNRDFSGTNDKKFLRDQIVKNQAVLDKINLSRLRNLCSDINNLKSQIGKNNNDACSSINNIIKDSNREIEKATRRLNILIGVERDDEAQESAHNRTIFALDKEIELADNKSKNLDSELKDLKSNNKAKSLDDFLANKTNTSSTNDFLASPSNNSSNGNDDFLSKNNDGNKDDFLSDKNTIHKDFKIEYKDGLNGVVNSKGQILIPFREWSIDEFKNGIAKVSIKVDSYTDEINSFQGYGATAYRTGFVDFSGRFLDGTSVYVYGGWYDNNTYLVLVYDDGSEDTRSSAQIERDKETYKRKKAKEKRDCINKGKQWKINAIRKYR